MTTDEMEESLSEIREANPKYTISGPLIRGLTCTVEMTRIIPVGEGTPDKEVLPIKMTNYEVVEPADFRELFENQILQWDSE